MIPYLKGDSELDFGFTALFLACVEGKAKAGHFCFNNGLGEWR